MSRINDFTNGVLFGVLSLAIGHTILKIKLLKKCGYKVTVHRMMDGKIIAETDDPMGAYGHILNDAYNRHFEYHEPEEHEIN